jgi:hypothetical protein
MIFHDQNRSCHPERSEGSLTGQAQILRCAQNDNTFPILVVKFHYRPLEGIDGLVADKSAVRA